MAFLLPAIASAGSAIASGAGTVGSALASGAGALGHAIASGAGGLGSGILSAAKGMLGMGGGGAGASGIADTISGLGGLGGGTQETQTPKMSVIGGNQPMIAPQAPTFRQMPSYGMIISEALKNRRGF
jgi:hypothetical protein